MKFLKWFKTLIFVVLASIHRSLFIFSAAARWSFALCNSTTCLSAAAFKSLCIFISISFTFCTNELHFSVRSVFSWINCSMNFWCLFTIPLYFSSCCCNLELLLFFWLSNFSHANFLSVFNCSFKSDIVASFSSSCNWAVIKSSLNAWVLFISILVGPMLEIKFSVIIFYVWFLFSYKKISYSSKLMQGKDCELPNMSSNITASTSGMLIFVSSNVPDVYA